MVSLSAPVLGIQPPDGHERTLQYIWKRNARYESREWCQRSDAGQPSPDGNGERRSLDQSSATDACNRDSCDRPKNFILIGLRAQTQLPLHVSVRALGKEELQFPRRHLPRAWPHAVPERQRTRSLGCGKCMDGWCGRQRGTGGDSGSGETEHQARHFLESASASLCLNFGFDS